MPTVNHFAFASLLALLPLLSVGCDGGSDETVTADLATIPCTPHELQLTGKVDETSFSLEQPANTGGFSQDDAGGDFGSINNVPQPEPPFTDLHLVWRQAILSGDSAPATGSFEFAPTAETTTTFCVGDGSAVRVTKDGALQFRLRGLASGTDCSVARAGELRGAWCP